MKVNLTIDVDDADRYLIATYFREAGPQAVQDAQRTRATRRQVRRFVAAACRLALKERCDALHGRTRTHAEKLRLTEHINAVQREVLTPPVERNARLFT